MSPPVSEDEISSSDEDDDDDEQADKGGPGSYASLLQSLGSAVTTEPHGKKRKRKYLSNEEVSSGNNMHEPGVESEEEKDRTEISANDSANEQLQHEFENSMVEADDEDPSDPFEVHFDNPAENSLSKKLKAVNAGSWKTEPISSSTIGKLSFTLPALGAEDIPFQHHRMKSVRDAKLKQRLLEPALEICPQFTDLQSTLAPQLFTYSDVFYGGRTVENADGLRTMACLHALNHVFKTRDRIIKNTARLSRDQADSNLDLRDQGFTRPKILILLETRQSCVRYMQTITDLCDPDQVENKKRFQDAFVDNEPKFSDDKPEDFKELFEGNDDNDWRLGIKFTRKTLKYYSQFYSSDIILASPLGLRRATKSDE